MTLIVIAVGALVLSVAQPSLFAQVRRGSLSGTVYDPAGAVIAGAQVSLKDQATAVTRNTVTNGEGFFYFAGVEPGSYTVTITAKGFSGWEQKNVIFNQAENRTLTNISLKMGAETEKIEVSADTEVVPLTTSESRTTITSQMLPEMAIQGRNASELVKIMPGMGLNTGLGQKAWDSQTTATNSGPIGQYTASGGQPYGGLSMTTDGAQIVDPGNQGTQVANINQDMTQEVTLLNATYGAESAKGPVTFQAIGKSGGKDFHGNAYLYTRNGTFNSGDWWNNHNGIQSPADSYYYPGGSLGGPVIIPGTGFNKNRDKLFFFTAYEYMKQQPVGNLSLNFIPTDQMLGGAALADCNAAGIDGPCGNFTQDYLNSLGLNNGNHGGTAQVPCDPGQSSQWWYGSYCANGDHPDGAKVASHGGYIPKDIMDPNALALATLFPKPNRAPSFDQPYNFQYLNNSPVNRWEYRVRIDYNVTQSTKISGSYTWQNERDINNIGVWWWPQNTIPYPTGMGTNQKSRTANVSVTTVFSPTLTNDFTFGWAYFINPYQPNDASKMDPASIGYTAHGPFTDANVRPQIPNMQSWGCALGSANGCFPIFYAPAFPQTGWSGNAFGKDSRVPSITDNVSKVFGTHTMKFGFYWDENTNNQTEGYGSWAQGQYDFDNYMNNTTGNLMADFVLGHGGYNQISHVPINDLRYHQVSFYAQDQWKATRKMTLTYGLRFDHEGQWYVNNKFGIATWDPTLYDPSTTDSPQWTGLTWHGNTSRVPLSGWTSPTFYYAPRLGVAYDLFGTGRTVIRGGFGVYRWQVSGNDISGGLDQPQGIRNTACSGNSLFKMADAQNCTAATFTPANAANGNISVLKLGDNKTPYTQNWSVIVSQALPWKSTLELQYQGNRTRNALLAGNGTNVQFYPNINKIPLGALFGPNPVTENNVWLNNCLNGRSGEEINLYTCSAPDSGAGLADYRPYANYDRALVVNTHGSYSNYNAMMVSWQKQRGPITFLANYTWSKVMGIRDGQTNNGNGDGQINDAFVLANNYAPLGYDHTHIFNVAYVVHLPSLIHGSGKCDDVMHCSGFLGGLLNGWELSGISQVQSGAPIQPNTNGSMNAQFNPADRNVFGTDGQRLMPILICDPRVGLAKGQYFNPNCFTSPVPAQLSVEDNTTIIPGINGQPVWPYIHGPAYMNHDLSLYKNFKIKESMGVQFRLNAFNFLNHPLPQFNLASDVNLDFQSGAGAPIQDGEGGYTIPTSCSLGAAACNQNGVTNGKPYGKVGRRVLEFAVKFTF